MSEAAATKSPRRSRGRKRSTAGNSRITEEQYERIFELYRQGKSAEEIAGLVGVSAPTVRRYIKHGGGNFKPCRERLEGLNKATRERLYSQHAEKASARYDTADSIYQDTMAAVKDVMEIMKDHLADVKTLPRAERDHKQLNAVIANANAITDLAEKWRSVCKAIYVGDANEDTVRDLEKYRETGELTPALRAELREIIGEDSKRSVDGGGGAAK